MDGLANYGSEDDENTQEPLVSKAESKDEEVENVSETQAQQSARLESEWESFEKLFDLGGDGKDPSDGPQQQQGTGEGSSLYQPRSRSVSSESSGESDTETNRRSRSPKKANKDVHSDSSRSRSHSKEKRDENDSDVSSRSRSRSPQKESCKRDNKDSAEEEGTKITESENVGDSGLATDKKDNVKKSLSRSRSRDRSKHRSSSRSRSRERSKRSGSRDNKSSRNRDRKRSRSRSRDRRKRRRRVRSRRSGSRGRRRRSGSRHRRHRRRSHSRDKRHRGRRRRSGSRDYRSRSRDRDNKHRMRKRSRSITRGDRTAEGKIQRGPGAQREPQKADFKTQLKNELKKAAQEAMAANADENSGKNAATGLPAGSNVTPQQALIQTMMAMHQKAQELTGVQVPKYYNIGAVNPLKYAEQVQKRKLLWSKAKEHREENKAIWQGTEFNQDNDGKMANKFRKLMGLKEGDTAETSGTAITSEAMRKKQEELFSRLDKEYEFARMTTHTHRGVGLGALSHGTPDPQLLQMQQQQQQQQQQK
ncbi:arginine/serine-rich coiled-coil protein 2-like [Lingula anatina]|uniref:Arginine/serine-rich coiled-coil protein 2-like n=1 Tax=Lingula anatina TaxID=7574 RepID=A0A1S3JS37_LINAN|nr:arginine/serine-rich coiled-coil protein 2-like [Lingula anatina]|eukprot:XP_013413190.1 arginine/serine-rich coiled-coil protein 2-like [Lingula anatina]